MNLAFFISLAVPPVAGPTPWQDTFLSLCKRNEMVLQWVCLSLGGAPLWPWLPIPGAAPHPWGWPPRAFLVRLYNDCEEQHVRTRCVSHQRYRSLT